MNFDEWIKAQPTVFPKLIGYGNTPYQNPVIGDDLGQTYINVRQIIALILDTLNPYETSQPVDLTLHSQALWGLIHILECASGALRFEEQFRLDSVLRSNTRPNTDSSNADRDTKKPSEQAQPKPPPSQTYHVFYQTPNGEEKHIGKVLL
jgi:hypothetical protein